MCFTIQYLRKTFFTQWYACNGSDWMFFYFFQQMALYTVFLPKHFMYDNVMCKYSDPIEKCCLALFFGQASSSVRGVSMWGTVVTMLNVFVGGVATIPWVRVVPSWMFKGR